MKRELSVKLPCGATIKAEREVRSRLWDATITDQEGLWMTDFRIEISSDQVEVLKKFLDLMTKNSPRKQFRGDCADGMGEEEVTG